MSSRALVLTIAAALGPFAASAAESSLRCDGGLVSIGDAKLDLLGKCGEPALRDARPVSLATVVVQPGPLLVAGASTGSTVEQWTYNFGPQRFLELVTLEGGKVVAIERGGYGYDPTRLRGAGPGGRAACESAAFHVGDLKIDLLARCGEPATLDVRQESRAAALPGQPATLASFGTVQVEVWTYDLGPQRFIAIVTLEDGKVVAVERGGYGYAR